MIDEMSEIEFERDPQEWSEEILMIKTRELDDLIEKKKQEVLDIEYGYYGLSESKALAEQDKKHRLAAVELLFLKMRRRVLDKHANLVKS